MIQILLPAIFLFAFAFFNLFGIQPILATNHFFNLIIAAIAYMIVLRLKKFFYSNTTFFYWLFIAIILITYIIGMEVKGSRRWIDLFVFNFQASEFFKIFFILYFSKLFSSIRKRDDLTTAYVQALFYFILPTFLIYKQPDLGNAMVFAFIFIVMIFFSEIPKIKIYKTFLTFVLLTPFLWLFLKDYQKNRLLSFFNHHIEQQGSAYNMIQAMITIGSGRLMGRGLGLGTQSRLFFLPENSTDFAFASLIEQFGFLGGFVVLGLFAFIAGIFITRLISLGRRHDEDSRFKFFYLAGLFAYFIFQVIVNIGMNLGLLPIAGIALPFISYGGSQLVTFMIGFALIP